MSFGLSFNKIFLAVVLKINCKEMWAKEGRAVR